MVFDIRTLCNINIDYNVYFQTVKPVLYLSSFATDPVLIERRTGGIGVHLFKILFTDVCDKELSKLV